MKPDTSEIVISGAKLAKILQDYLYGRHGAGRAPFVEYAYLDRGGECHIVCQGDSAIDGLGSGNEDGGRDLPYCHSIAG